MLNVGIQNKNKGSIRIFQVQKFVLILHRKTMNFIICHQFFRNIFNINLNDNFESLKRIYNTQ